MWGLMDKIKYIIKNNNYLLPDDLLRFIETIFSNSNLKQYISDIVIDSNIESSYTNYGEFSINPNELWYLTGKKYNTRNESRLITNREKKYNYSKNPNRVNLFNIFVIYHEFRHVYQLNALSNIDKSINDWYTGLLYKDLITGEIDNKINQIFYKSYHDYFFSEYDANINGYINTLNLFNSFDISELNKLIKLFNKMIATNLIYLYRDMNDTKKVSTPNLNMLKLYRSLYRIINEGEKELLISVNNLKSIDKPKEEIKRLELGFSLKKETMKYIYNISKGKDKTLNLFDDIKNM